MPLKFKVDENLPAEVSVMLREAGHDALSVIDQRLGGSPDDEIAKVCQQERRIIVTLDTDFANIIAYPPQWYSGIIVIRTEDQSRCAVLKLIPRILTTLDSEPINGKLWIVELHRIRMRE